jgi:hypothetical protein
MKNMTLKNLTPHIIAFIFYIYNIYSFIIRASGPETFNIDTTLIMTLEAFILFFALPAIYIGEVLSVIWDVEWGINFFQIKLFYYFLYALLIFFTFSRIIGEILY